MAKIYGLFGAMTGKVADAVMVVRNGEQIVRKYQPVVSNPSSEGQVAARAKLKLMSQLSAVMAPIIAMPRQGSVSSRNLFTKVNYKLATYANNSADIPLADVQLTKSVVAMPPVSAVRADNTITAKLEGTIGTLDVDKVVYVAITKQPDSKLRLTSSAVATTPGANNDWSTTITGVPQQEAVILAYGIRNNTEAARVIFDDMIAPTAETVAKVITNRQLLESDITLTETRGVTLPAPL